MEPTSSDDHIDFRSSSDDAWYDATAVEEGCGDVIVIKYCGFPDTHDERFRVDAFGDAAELSVFRRRVRRPSPPLQDSECRDLRIGTVVTAAHKFRRDDVRFYDAVVDEVKSTDHPLAEGQCNCTFLVKWLHGPLAGYQSLTKIDDICLLQPEHLTLDPVVEKFLEKARQKLEERNSIENLSNMPTATRSSDYKLKKTVDVCKLKEAPSSVLNTCFSNYDDGCYGGSLDPSKVSRDIPNCSRDCAEHNIATCTDGHRGSKVGTTGHVSPSGWSKNSLASPFTSVDDHIIQQTDDRRFQPEGEDIDYGSGSSSRKRAQPEDIATDRDIFISEDMDLGSGSSRRKRESILTRV